MSIVDDRQETHGDPVENMTRVAGRWSRILGVTVTGKQVAECMAELHVVRRRMAPRWDPAHLQHERGYREIAEMFDARGG